MNIKIYGLEKLEKTLNVNINKVFDTTIKKNARQSLSNLIRTTNVDEGNTHRAWQRPKKLKNSVYEISNNIMTEDKKHFIVNILDKGRKTVYPKITNKSQLLYIPIGPSRLGRKKLGSYIPKNAIYGKHYIFAKKSKAFKGTNFIKNEVKLRERKMEKDILKKTKKYFS